MEHRTASPVHCCHVNSYRWEWLTRGNWQQGQSQHNWNALLSVGVTDSVISVDSNWLPEKMVCEYELTVRQTGKMYACCNVFREWVPWDLKEKEDFLYLITKVGDIATDFSKALKVWYHINKWRKVWETQYCLVYIQSSANCLLAFYCL